MPIQSQNCRVLAMAAALWLVAGCSGNPDEPMTAAPPAEPAAVAGTSGPRPSAATHDAPADTASQDVSIVEQSFAYGATKDRNYVGFFAAPEQIVEPLPGIVLVHERWGLDDSIRAIARDLARAGYAVMAVDLFDGATAEDATSAQSLVALATAQREALLDNIGQAVDYLRAYALAPRVALVGYGLGGGLVLESAIAAPEKIDAVVTYYGRPIFGDDLLGNLRAPVLGHYAERDESIPVRDVQSFRRALRERNAAAEVLIYSDAWHGFADRGRASYEPRNADEAWSETIDFLAAALVPARP